MRRELLVWGSSFVAFDPDFGFWPLLDKDKGVDSRVDDNSRFQVLNSQIQVKCMGIEKCWLIMYRNTRHVLEWRGGCSTPCHLPVELYPASFFE